MIRPSLLLSGMLWLSRCAQVGAGLAKAHCDFFAQLPRQGKYPIT